MQQTILIVEDSIINQKLLAKIFIKQNYQVLIAGSGEESLEIVKHTLPDLIVLDIILPGINGFTTCEYLKKDVNTSDIPVVFISSLDSTRDKLEGFETGGVDYITKPFEPAEVIARIATHLRIHQLQHKLEEKNQLLLLEKQKSQNLLYNVLPKSVGMELLKTGECAPQLFTETTVCFVDIIGFTAASSAMAPEVILQELNEIFTAFDRITLKNSCERMKTIGDAFLFVCGVPVSNENHTENVARAAFEMVDFLKARNHTAAHIWQLRVGMHSGPLVGGVVGTEKYLYDIFGDTVNIAARMEELAQPMQVNVSSASYELLKNTFVFSDGERVEMKGKGQQMIYTLRSVL
ncbi:response regulator [Desulfocapsa sp. AH-315-G09]|nr:response regulator [Desulfocapsa sp.]MBN4048531.1 response regulator [bacterium AH-315-N22]MBN4065195.1 response regulator [Desulfocapsa sp. AH-315-G09]